MDPHCRIGRVKLRGGADLHIIPNANAERHAETMKALAETINHVAYENGEQVAGFALVMWCADGTVSSRSWIAANSPVLSTMVPHMAAEALRRHQVREISHSTVQAFFGIAD